MNNLKKFLTLIFLFQIFAIYMIFSGVSIAQFKVALYSPANEATKVSVNPTLDWQDYKDPEGERIWYQLQVAKDIWFSSIIWDHGAGNEGEDNSIFYRSYCDIKNLDYNTVYYWRVMPWRDAEGGNYNGEWSDVWSFQTLILPEPSRPSLELPAYGSIGISKTPTFKWIASYNALWYTLEISENTTSNIIITINNIGGISYTLSNIDALANNTLYYWRIWANNEEQSKVSDEWYFRTNAPPQIESLFPNPSDPIADQAIQIKAIIYDDVDIPKTTLFYRNGGEVAFRMLDLTYLGGTAFISAVDAKYINSRGLEYYVVATDELGESSQSPLMSLQVLVPEPGILRPSAQPSSRKAKGYRIVSFPLDLEKKSPKDILADDLGNYNKTKWRFFEYGSDQKNHEYSEISEIASGRGYWLIVADKGKQIDTGAGKTISTLTPFKIALHAGYNLVGNPFNFAIPMNKVSLENEPIFPTALTYSDTGWQALTDSLRPFEGFAISINDSTNLVVNPNLTGMLNKTEPEKTDWSIQIIACCQDARDAYNFAGVSAAASNDYDMLDYPEPPGIGDYVSLYFPHPEWEKILDNYCRDIRNEIVQYDEWDFAVRTNINNKIQLQFKGLEELPSDLKICLADEKAQIAQDLRDVSRYEIAAPSAESPYQLKLLVGKNNYLIQKLTDTMKMPTNYDLAQNFPNPFNQETMIKYAFPSTDKIKIMIFNIMGQKIRTLINEYQTAGRYNIHWDGEDDFGTHVTSGIYLIRMEAGKFVAVKKMVLAR